VLKKGAFTRMFVSQKNDLVCLLLSHCCCVVEVVVVVVVVVVVKIY